MEYTNIYNDDYLKAIRRKQQHVKFKIETVDWTENNVLEEITEDIIDGSGSITVNYQQGVRRSFNCDIVNESGYFTPSHETAILYATTKLKVYVGIEYPNKKDIYWWKQGVFLLKSVSDEKSYDKKVVSINCVDKFGIFTSDLNYMQLQGDYKIPEGTIIYDAIRNILSTDMENGNIIDYQTPKLELFFSSEVMPYTLVKAKGTEMGDLLIELANVLGCNIYYDTSGCLVIESGTDDVTYSQHGVIYAYDNQYEELTNFSIDYDYGSIVNSVTVIGTNVNDAVYTHTAKNESPISPTRIEYVGLKATDPVESAVIYSDDRARDYAIYLLKNKTILQAESSFDSMFIPHLDVDRVITITDEDLNYYEERLIVTSLNIPISTKDIMTIGCTNVASLPYYELTEGSVA